MDTKNIMIVGVGGQGTLLASKLLGRILLENGYDVKVSEVHGMSQRGGSVVTYVRYGEKVYSPIIDKGEADFVLSFELLEAARWTEYLKESYLSVTRVSYLLVICQLPPFFHVFSCCFARNPDNNKNAVNPGVYGTFNAFTLYGIRTCQP